MQLRIRVEKTILITKLFLAACSSSHLVTGYSLFLNPIYKKKIIFTLLNLINSNMDPLNTTTKIKSQIHLLCHLPKIASKKDPICTHNAESN